MKPGAYQGAIKEAPLLLEHLFKSEKTSKTTILWLFLRKQLKNFSTKNEFLKPNSNSALEPKK